MELSGRLCRDTHLASAVRSCICMIHGSDCTYFDRAEDPKDEGLDHDERRTPDAERKVNANVLADIRVLAFVAVDFGPLLKPDATPCVKSVFKTCPHGLDFRADVRHPGNDCLEKINSRSRLHTNLSCLSADQHD